MTLVLLNAWIQNHFSRGCMTFTMLYLFLITSFYMGMHMIKYSILFFLIILYNSDMMNLDKNLNYPACIGRCSCSYTVKYIYVTAKTWLEYKLTLSELMFHFLTFSFNFTETFIQQITAQSTVVAFYRKGVLVRRFSLSNFKCTTMVTGIRLLVLVPNLNIQLCLTRFANNTVC